MSEKQWTVVSGQWKMRTMKRSWITYLIIAGVAGLIVLLGGLQYRWLSQISESDGDKARTRVKEQTDRFAMDFNREIQNSYFNFQTDAETWKAKDWNEFGKRYEYWKKNSQYPDLVTDFYFFETKADTRPLHYDVASQAFVEVDETPELAAVRAKAVDLNNFKPVDAESMTLLLPVHDGSKKEVHMRMRMPSPEPGPVVKLPERYGCLVIKLDPAVIKEKILSDLTAKYFGDNEFNVAVSDKAGNAVFQSLSSEATDATAPLFELTPDNFVFYSNKDTMSAIGGLKKMDAKIINSHVESRTFSRVESVGDSNGTVKIELKSDAPPRTSVFTATTTINGAASNPWTLLVQHSSGSLDGFIASTLRRNLAIGFGILFLLAAAVGAIVISSMRARSLAQRQIDFVSSVSHEFRTPLAVIYSAGENLADGVAKETAQVSRYGDLIKGEGRKLSSMVEQILEFAGANAGRRRFNLTPTSVDEVVESAVAGSRSLVGERAFEIETDIANGLPTIRADKAALSQAVENLVANSIKYCNGDAWLRVSASNGDGVVKITVEDRGIGISKSDLRQIFEPFYRSKEVVDAQIHGNGLGLSLVKQIAKAHGGRVRATSELGKGSKFTIEIPQKEI